LGGEASTRRGVSRVRGIARPLTRLRSSTSPCAAGEVITTDSVLKQPTLRRPYCLRHRARLHSLCPSFNERGMVRRVTQPSPCKDDLLSKAAASLDAPPRRLHCNAGPRFSRAALCGWISQPGGGPSVASGGAPTWPECRFARPARGRRTGRGPELPGAVQEGRAAASPTAPLPSSRLHDAS
jgi:hypothetical protein